MSEEENKQEIVAEEAAEKISEKPAEAAKKQAEDLVDDIEELEPEDVEVESDDELSEEERAQKIQQLKPIVEGAILAAGDTLKINKIQSLFEDHEMPGKKLLLDVLAAIKADCEGRGFDLVEVASGWRFQVREDFAVWVNRLWEEKPQKYSRALLETLALIAYRQPITRGDIEEVRGVAVSSHIIKTLSEREWVKVVGHRDVPGRPALYATTRHFLDYFNLKSLEQLPALGELKDIDSLNESLELADANLAEESNEAEQSAAQESTAESPENPPEISETDSQEADELMSAGENLNEPEEAEQAAQVVELSEAAEEDNENSADENIVEEIDEELNEEIDEELDEEK